MFLLNDVALTIILPYKGKSKQQISKVNCNTYVIIDGSGGTGFDDQDVGIGDLEVSNFKPKIGMAGWKNQVHILYVKHQRRFL